jgi:hypothetical protein
VFSIPGPISLEPEAPKFAISFGSCKVILAVIPANPGSGPAQAPESRTASKSWIPGRASLVRNGDFLLLSKVLQELHNFKNM